MPDAVDRILNGDEKLTVLATPKFVMEIAERFTERLAAATLELPERPAMPDEDEPEDLTQDETPFEQEKRFQEAFQAKGAELLPAMQAISDIVVKGTITHSLIVMERLARNNAFMYWWGYMLQHTNINEFRARLGE